MGGVPAGDIRFCFKSLVVMVAVPASLNLEESSGGGGYRGTENKLYMVHKYSLNL